MLKTLFLGTPEYKDSQKNVQYIGYSGVASYVTDVRECMVSIL